MMADEGAGSGLQMTIQMTHEAVTITSAVTRLSTSALGQIMRVAGAGLKRMKTKHLETGKVTIARLQRQTGGDLHALPITHELERSVKADLRRRGTNFSIEHGADGGTYVHFSGRDVDEVQHGLQQAAARFSQRHGRNAGEERSRAPRAEADEPEAEVEPPAPEPEVEPPAPEPEASGIDAWLSADPIVEPAPEQRATQRVRVTCPDRSGQADQAQHEPTSWLRRPAPISLVIVLVVVEVFTLLALAVVGRQEPVAPATPVVTSSSTATVTKGATVEASPTATATKGEKK